MNQIEVMEQVLDCWQSENMLSDAVVANLTAAIEAAKRAEFDMKAFYEFWNHYSSLNEMFQDELNVYRLAWLDRMLAADRSFG